MKATNPGVAAAFANAVANQVVTLQGNNGLYTTKQILPATPPTSPANPTKPVLFAAVGFGVIFAVFAGLASAGVRRRFSRVTELKERIGATVLGEIPRVMSGNIRPSNLFVLGRQPMVMEAFQELRSNLLLSIPDGGPTSIAVTSCDPSEGKTSVVANMAWVLAAEGRHVTAVDSDLRKPMLHLELEVPFGPGLASGGRPTPSAMRRRRPTPISTWFRPGSRPNTRPTWYPPTCRRCCTVCANANRPSSSTAHP